MKIHIGNIIDQMSADVRKQAEQEAASRGLTLDKFVETQLTAQLTEQELRVSAAKIRFDRWDIRGDSRPTDKAVRVGAGIRGRF
jgi:hypothetical protein